MIQAATFPPPLFGVVFGLAVSRICKKINKRLLLLQQALSTLLSQCVLQSFIDFNSLQMITSFYFYKSFLLRSRTKVVGKRNTTQKEMITISMKQFNNDICPLCS